MSSFNHRARRWGALAAPFTLLSAWGLAAPTPFVAHEWGTFTSLVDSRGQILEGLQHEDEALPDFVHSRYGDLLAQQARGQTVAQIPPCHGKGCDWFAAAGTPLAVSQKMETPVIYFYSDRARDVQVDVGFPGGIITQWFPQATSYAPAVGQVNAVAQGNTRWNIRVEAPGQHPAGPVVEPSSVWAPSRQVAANTVTAGGESERFIFYRGLGQFNTALTVSSVDTHLVVKNGSDQNIPDAFVLEVTESGGHIAPMGAVPAGQERRGSIFHKVRPMEAYVANASTLIQAALVRSGLYEDEARAMVNTWKVSYFRTPGLRVLYVLPRPWTDQLLPLTLQPQPDQVVRTLVGRVEVMSGAEEQMLLDELRTADAAHTRQVVQRLGRFAEPKLRRLSQLAEAEPALRERIQQLLRSASVL